VVKSTSENAPKKTITKKSNSIRRKRISAKRDRRFGDRPAGSRSAEKAGERQIAAAILVGFMGAGKSSVGKALAPRLGWAFEDLDDRIERREGRKIHEIFRTSGEHAFRRAEHVALRELLLELKGKAKKVIAMGGGAFVQAGNFKLIESAGIPTVFLDAPAKELWRRCCAQSTKDGIQRPLLRSTSSFRELYEVRRPHYLRASLRVETLEKTVNEISAEVAEAIGQFSGQQHKGRKRGDKN
jgi:shikimate kinase